MDEYKYFPEYPELLQLLQTEVNVAIINNAKNVECYLRILLINLGGDQM